MCGICGQVNFAGVDRHAVEVMANALTHRGPDGYGFHISPVAALGHRRLSIIDLQTGGQPLANEDETVWLTFNGEIYNYRALREDLIAHGHRFRTHSDSEVIVHLYEQYGTACVKRLQGMFAFAIWDVRQQRLFAARDRLGQKPLYYVQRNGSLVFASEIKALLAYDPTLATLNLAALDQYLALRLVAPPHSMFAHIKKLPPAHMLRYDARSGLTIERYWQINYEPKHQGSVDDLTDELQARLIQCLKAHTVSDVPVGAFLSGGVDSSLVVAMLQQHINRDLLQTFSVGLPYKAYDETPFARLVAERYGTVHHERRLPTSLLDTLPRVIWQLDEPSDPLSLCYFFIAAMAREQVKVVLGGDGGDELFGGYDRYYGQRYAGYYAWLPPSLRRSVIGPLLRFLPDGQWYKSRSHRLKWLHEMSFHEAGDRYAHSLGYFYFTPGLREQLYGARLHEATVHLDVGEPIRTAFDNAQAYDPLDRMLYADSQIRLPDHSVMILDRMTMAHGLEARSPLMDHELAEFAARLPHQLKVHGRSLRYIQMRLAQRYLPEPLLHRSKQGFSSALPYMLKNEYQTLFQQFLRRSHLVREGFFRQPTIDSLLAEQQAGKADHGNRLWLLLNSELWYRLFIEHETVAAMTEEIRDATQLKTATRVIVSINESPSPKEQQTDTINNSVAEQAQDTGSLAALNGHHGFHPPLNGEAPHCTFTVFTATYNRAYTLPRVYHSLCSQTFRDFEWLIVDDGSTDNTRELVTHWQQAGQLSIRYLRQENCGRHVAFNRGVCEARGELFLNCDSDDTCVPHALERFHYHWQSIPPAERERFSAVTALCMDQEGKLIGDKFPRDIIDSDPLEMLYKYKVRGGKWGFQRTDVLRQFPFPTLTGVKFVPEHVVWSSIARHYRTRFVNEQLLTYYYHEDHRSDQLSTPMNPAAQALAYVTGRQFSLNEEIAWFRYAPQQFVWAALQYARFACHARLPFTTQYRELHNGLAKTLWATMLPLGWAAYGAERLVRRG